jgi:hypothetical protein
MIHTNKGFCKTGQVLLEDIFHVVPLKVATNVVYELALIFGHFAINRRTINESG